MSEEPSHFRRKDRRVPQLFTLMLIISFLLCLACSVVRSDELQILLDFRSALAESNKDAFASWTTVNGRHACNFTGVACNSDGLVTELVLPASQLHGTLPLDTLCKLPSLEVVSLESNYLYGALPVGIRNCSRLKHLDLSKNFISGSVPDLSPLGQLRFLNLNGSAFSGTFPWKSLRNLTGLEFLSLGDNPFDRTPFPEELAGLTRLYWLYLTNSSLVGQLPEGIGNLTQLRDLELSGNELFGELPMGISNLRNLWQLELYDNKFVGSLPAGFGNLTGLVNLDASQNRLEGGIGELKSMTNLASLLLYENQLSGSVPEEFGDFRDLQEFSLFSNRFSGPLPRRLGSWSEFLYIDVSDNFFSGAIPPEMCRRNRLVKLLLLDNGFSGEIPATYSNCTSLERLRLRNNSLSGEVPPGIWGLPNLKIIDLTFNGFEGPVSPSIGHAKSLAQVFLSDNRFAGELPPEISGVSSLASIILKSNRFTGGIPAEIGRLKNLNNLHLEGNMFSGTMPESLGYCVSLNEINLAGNYFSGNIPATLGSLPSLNSLNLSSNQLTGEIPGSFSSLKLSLLDLSDNGLTGSVPDSLAIGPFNASFSGNPALCSQIIPNMRPCNSDSASGKRRSIRTGISCFAAGAAVLLLSLACVLFMKVWRNGRDRQGSGMVSWNMKSFQILSFTEQEIIGSIKQENLIGKGGSGNVYKVDLGNGNALAVKHIWKSEADHQESCHQSSTVMLANQKRRRQLPEYEAEVAALSSIRHVHVVKLYCSISSEDSNLLVYEYMPNGSLWDRLHSSCHKMHLEWEARYNIAVGAARGLEYLHHGCDHPMIHRDVKSSNILLDEHLKPRIADFGLAKIMPPTASTDSIQVIAGSYGYIAPEYAYTTKVTEKSDVYSFGVVLMELVTGRRPVEPEFGDGKDIVGWVWSKIKNDNEGLIELVDTSIPEAQRADAIKVLRIAVQCASQFSALRPSMRRVVQMLEKAEPCRLTGIVVEKGGQR